MAGWCGALLALTLSLGALLSQTGSPRPDINTLKKGVVRVRNTRFGDVGTGIIIKINRDEAYIVTASHVVRGNERPEVYLFTRQKEALRASLIHREDDDQKGLALLWVKANEQTLTGLSALSLGSSFGLQGREEVTLIGFPDGTPFWTVTPGSIARREGRNLVFLGTISMGNSGGPVLLDGRVVGLVTDFDLKFGYAVEAESVALYIRGVEPELAELMVTTTKNSPDKVAPADEFCQSLTTLVTASKNGFESIKGERSENHFHSTLHVPGTLNGYIISNEEAYYYLLIDENKQKVETEYDKAVSKLKRCLMGWQQKEVRKDYRYYKFRESNKGTVVSVRYNLKLHSNNVNYYLSLQVYPPGNSEW